MKKPLPYRLEAYRLWFRYLQLAKQNELAKVQNALKRRAKTYERWGDITNVEFDDWWEENHQLFEDESVVRRLGPEESRADSQSLVVEIPLRRSHTALMREVAVILSEELAKQPRQGSKSRKSPTSEFKLTAGSEPKLKSLRLALEAYTIRLQSGLRGKRLLNVVENHYKNRKRDKDVPEILDPGKGSIESRLKTLNRYLRKAEKIVLNVANGEFPGKY